MTAAALLEKHPKPTDEQIDQSMAGNLCRCGTYARIREAIKKAAGVGRVRREPRCVIAATVVPRGPAASPWAASRSATTFRWRRNDPRMSRASLRGPSRRPVRRAIEAGRRGAQPQRLHPRRRRTAR